MIRTTVTSAQLKAEYAIGYDEDGEQTVVSKSFGEANPNATPESIMNTCKAFESLLDYPLVRGLRTIVTAVLED